MAYEMGMSISHPGCLVILLDQSAAMAGVYPLAERGAGRLKAEIVAAEINVFLHDLVRSVFLGGRVRPVLEVAVLGYGNGQVRPLLSGALAFKSFVNLNDLNNNPIRIVARKKKEMDDTGQIIEIPVYLPTWIEPFADRDAPMCAALKHARTLVKQWIAVHTNSFPPLVVNVASGRVSDGDPAGAALDLRRIATTDGETLLFNYQITGESVTPLEFPSDELAVPQDPSMRLLFGLSSPIPNVMRNDFKSFTGYAPPSGARGYILDGDFDHVRYLFAARLQTRYFPSHD